MDAFRDKIDGTLDLQQGQQWAQKSELDSITVH